MPTPPHGGDGTASEVESVEAAPTPDRPSRALPPPIPRAAATRRGFAAPTQVASWELDEGREHLRRRLQAPTAVERALRERSGVDVAARAAALERAAASNRDPGEAALVAYELGELYETQLRDVDKALAAYHKAADLDGTLRAATWSIRRLMYRRRALDAAASVIDRELATATGPEHQALLVERAAVRNRDAREALEKVLAAEPAHQIALLQLERILVASDSAADTARLHAVWRQLAEVVGDPGRKLGYLLDLAWATRAGFDEAARVAGKRGAVDVANQQLLCMAAGGTPGEIEHALDVYTRSLIEALETRSPQAAAIERELVAVCWLLARHLRADRPADAWVALQQASTVSHGEPLVIVEQIELARAADQASELPSLVQAWKSVEDAAARQATVSRWAALAFSDAGRRKAWRTLVADAQAAVPGWIVGAAVAECDVLTSPRDAAARTVLAERYLATARAAARGTWLGGERGQPDPMAAAMLYVQAAEVFAYFLPDGSDVESAHSALDEARALVPGHAVVHEATIELEDSAGEPQEAIERLRAASTPEDAAPLVRALRIARTHGLIKVVFELERDLLERTFDVRLAWEHETTLMQLGRDDERVELLLRIARIETDHHRKYMALLGAARLNTRLGLTDTAIGLLQEMRTIEPTQQYPGEALVDALRRARRWPALVTERTSELASGGPRPRAALREIAWVQEVCVGDLAAAARAYATWVERIPEDQAALEGLARCSAATGDTATAVRAHEALAGTERPETARWLLARSLARAGAFDRAVAEYRELMATGREHVALTAALALVAIATVRDDDALRAAGTLEIASRTSDSRLAAALYEEVGWFSVLTSGETERAATSFAEAVARDPERTGAVVGCVLSAAVARDGGDLARRYVALAEAVGPELAAALKLRAAAVAVTEGDGAFADEQMMSVRALRPAADHATFLIVDAGDDHPPAPTARQSLVDSTTDRAKLLLARAALVEDPRTRAAFELDRAELLETAGLIHEVAPIVTAVVRAFPEDRRALLALRRLAREHDPEAWARATDALTRITRDPTWLLELRGDDTAVTDARRTAAVAIPSFEDAESAAWAHTNVDAMDPFESSTVLLESTALQDGELELAKVRATGEWDVQLPAAHLASFDGAALAGSIEQLVEAYTREANLATEPAELAALWTEAGRLWERLGDDGRAGAAYQAALAADPRWPRALRGARRRAYRARDVAEVLTLLAREIEVATGKERRALQRFRIDLLLATGADASARPAIDELLAEDVADVSAWMASLVVAQVTGDTKATSTAIAALARELPALGVAPLSGRTDEEGAAVADSDDAIGQKWQTIWKAAKRADVAAGVAAALDLAFHVEGEDPTLTTALAMFAQMYASHSGALPEALHEPALEAAKLSGRIAPREPLVVRLAAETALLANDPSTAAHSFAQWTRTKADPTERAYAAARAAELEPTRLGRMWSAVVEQHPDDDYAVSKLRAHHIAAGKLEEAIALELRSARAGGRLASMLDAAEMMVEEARIDEAIATLQEARTLWPASLAAVEAHADTLASVGRWAERAKVLDEAASVRGPAVGARDVLRLRAAAAWDLATSATESTAERARLDMVTYAALLACERVLGDDPASVFAHGTALRLAGNVPSRQALAGVLTRLAAVEKSPWARSSLALRRVRAVASDDPEEARDTARTVVSVDDPRWSVAFALAFDPPLPGEVVLSLEARAAHCEADGRTVEAATLWMRAAYLVAETGDLERTRALLPRFASALPRVAADLERAAGAATLDGGPPELTRLVRDADDAARRGEVEAAFSAARRALELRPTDPVAVLGHAVVGARLGNPVRAAAEQLEVAEASQDAGAELSASERLARASTGLGDHKSLIAVLRNALRIDPSRVVLSAWLEREMAAAGEIAALVQLRRDVVLRTAKWTPADRVAMLVDTALLSLRAGEEEDIVRACREVLVGEPHHPLALRQVESALRHASPSLELVNVYAQISTVVDRASSAAAHLRAGEVLAHLGKHADAAAAFARAIAAAPRYFAALDAWHASALDGARWPDLLTIARHRDAMGAPSVVEFQLAGVALMDGPAGREHADEAIAALHRVLALDPTQTDAFWRLWMILDTLGRRAELVELLRARSLIATERDERIELNRELAERLFVVEPSAALQHYRNIVASDPADVRAHAAIADLASVHAPWNAAADAVAARVALEREPRILHTLHLRLGALYAEHDDLKALAAFQRAAEHAPGDITAMAQVARIAVRQQRWPEALAASERLVVAEKDPAKLAEHLVRSATVFAQGFSNIERATRMLQLALETAPTSTVALEAVVDLLARRDPAALRGFVTQAHDRSRLQVEAEPTNGAAYRMLSRTSVARVSLGEPELAITARVAAEMATLFGAAEAAETALLAHPAVAARLRLANADGVLVPEAVPTALLAMLKAAAPAIKHVLGAELGAYGLHRKQRLRAQEPVHVAARAIAASLGLGEIDVYLAPHPHVTLAEPGDPINVLVGHAIAMSEPVIAFAVGAALKLAQMSLAIPARLDATALSTLIVALFEVAGVHVGPSTPEADTLAAQLRRHIAATARAELEQHARTVPTPEIPAFVRGLHAIGLRAGFASAGQLRAGLEYLAGVMGTTPGKVVVEPVARDLIKFALDEKIALLLLPG